MRSIGNFYLAAEHLAQYIRDPKTIKNALAASEISERSVGVAMNDMIDQGGFYLLYGNRSKYVFLLQQADVKRALGPGFSGPIFIQQINAIKGLDKEAREGLIHIFSNAVLSRKHRLLNSMMTARYML